MNVYVKKPPMVWRKTLATFLGIAALIALLNLGQAFVRNSFYAISNPFSASLAGATRLGLASANASLNFGAIGQENSNLKQENQELLSQIAALRSRIQQDEQIHLARETMKSTSLALMPATVVGIDVPQQTLTIDQGTEHGIVENMPIITAQKSVVGRVISVHNRTAVVSLISSAKSVVDVKIQPANAQQAPIHGVVRGNGAGKVALDLVSSDAQIFSGDVLVTSGLEGLFPKDLLVGTITEVEKNDVKAFQTASIKQFFDITSTGTVFVITNYKQ